MVRVDDDEIGFAVPGGPAVAHRAEPLRVRVEAEGVRRQGGTLTDAGMCRGTGAAGGKCGSAGSALIVARDQYPEGSILARMETKQKHATG